MSHHPSASASNSAIVKVRKVGSSIVLTMTKPIREVFKIKQGQRLQLRASREGVTISRVA